MLWKVFLMLGLGLLILEMLAPLTFFLSLSIGALVTSLFAVFFNTYDVLIPVFVVTSLLSLLLFRPFLRKNSQKTETTGIEEKYIDKTAKVEEKVTKFSGVITIYGERWEARTKNGDEIPEGAKVRILRNDSLIMYVEKV